MHNCPLFGQTCFPVLRACNGDGFACARTNGVRLPASPQHFNSMIERYTIKFGPAVSQKELEKALNEAKHPDDLKKFRQVKTRIELIGDIEDVKKLSDLLKNLASPGN